MAAQETGQAEEETKGRVTEKVKNKLGGIFNKVKSKVYKGKKNTEDA